MDAIANNSTTESASDSAKPAASAAWDDALLRDPHHVADKRQRVRNMFAAIAPSYDLNNRLHSLWQDQRWRRRAVELANLGADTRIVDVACGTGDLTLAFLDAAAAINQDNPNFPVVGVDFTFEMLPIARKKAHFSDDAALFLNGDAQSLPLPDAFADIVSIAFGIRNVQDPLIAMKEFHRVLRPGGQVIILEFSLPTNAILRRLYNFYFRQVLPRTATWISGDKTGAYKYLPQSVNTFIGRAAMMSMLRDAGFENVQQVPMTFGVCVCYRAFKPRDPRPSRSA